MSREFHVSLFKSTRSNSECQEKFTCHYYFIFILFLFAIVKSYEQINTSRNYIIEKARGMAERECRCPSQMECEFCTYIPALVCETIAAPVSRAATSGYGYSCENKKISSHHELLPEQAFIGGHCQQSKVRRNFAALGTKANRAAGFGRSEVFNGTTFTRCGRISIIGCFYSLRDAHHRPGGMYVAITSAQTINQRSTKP